MTARKSVIAQLNKLLKKGDNANQSTVNLLFMKLVLVDPVVWTDIYKAYLTKRDPGKSGAQEPEVLYPLDRGGK